MKVLIATLAHTGFIHTQVADMLLTIAKDERIESEFIFPRLTPIDEAKNRVIETFLKDDYDYLISTDDDTGCDKNPVDLLFLDRDIIFLPTPYLQNKEVVLNVDYDLTAKEELLTCKKGGTGCFILSRKAAEKIPKPLFNFTYDKDGYLEMGEDYNFSKKAAKAGFTLWTHKDYPCHHYKTMDLWRFTNNK